MVDPTNCITFLGIELDSVSMSLNLPHSKLDSFKLELQEFLQRKCGSKRQLQAIASRLFWAARVVKDGRVFLCHIFDQIGILKLALHKAVISPKNAQRPFMVVYLFRDLQRTVGHPRSTVSI